MSLFRPDQLELGEMPPPPAGEPSDWRTGRVLLTGATGLLGSALLDALLDSTETIVTCLVRGGDEEDAVARLLAALERRAIEFDWGRVAVVRGDLAAAELGLSETTLAELAASADLILHAGAEVSWWGDLGRIAATNLDSLRTLVRLAGTSRPKRLAFVSSCAVFNADAYSKDEIACERPLHEDPRGLRTPYVQSKWAGERICVEAARRGVSTSILRVPYLLPHRECPLPNPTGALDMLLAASARLGAVPTIGPRLPLCPANDAADRIVEIVRADPSAGSIHHVVPFESLPWSALTDALHEIWPEIRPEVCAGPSMRDRSIGRLPPQAWFEKAREAASADASLRRIVALLGRDPTRTLWSDANICRLRFDDAATRSLLSDLEPVRRLDGSPADRSYLHGAVHAMAADPSFGDGGSSQARPAE